jgi:hypothetical protein
MGTLRIASGRKWNILERGAVSVSSEHAQLVKARLYDGRPSRAYRAASAVTDLVITNDGNIVLNGGFESWPAGLPEFWPVLTGGAGSSVVAEGTIKVAGLNAARFTTGNVGGAFALVSQQWEARSGENRRCQSQARGDGTSAAMNMRLRNMITGNYLQSNGTWSTTPSAFASRIVATYAEIGLNYTVESFSACGNRDLITLQLEIYNDTQNTTTYVDECYDFPAFNCAALIGPSSILPYQAVQFRSSTDNFSVSDTLEGTFTNPLPLPSAYSLLGSTISRRYSRIKVTGTPLSAIELCEAAVCQVVQPTQDYDAPRLGAERWDQLSATTPGGERHVHKRSRFKVRSRTLRYTFAGVGAQAAHDNARELFFDRPEGELYPALVIPDTSLPDVMYARLLSSWSHADEQPDYILDATVEVQEMPFASTSS